MVDSSTALVSKTSQQLITDMASKASLVVSGAAGNQLAWPEVDDEDLTSFLVGAGVGTVAAALLTRRIVKKVVPGVKRMSLHAVKKSYAFVKRSAGGASFLARKGFTMAFRRRQENKSSSSSPKANMLSFARKKMQGRADQEVVDRMGMVGMDVQKKASSMVGVKAEHLPSVLEQELRAERFPEPVVRAIVDGASAGTDCAKFGETFEHTPDGRSHISKWSVWTRGCGDVAELAMLCTNVSFQTAKVIERFEEVQEPIVVTRSFRRAAGNLQRVEEGLPPNVTKSFRLAAGNLPRVEEGFPRNVGTRTIRRPLFREHVVNSADVEAIRRYVEHQVCCDALDTFGCSEDSGASKF
mmetsp:Transcript_93965/g.169722  ORF Transcript_93965/g.169722 Transcript_93965/m.169722 type:complete len:354 (-) Transcript_93965:192-1253(-)